MDFIAPILLILGGILAASGVIVAKQPNARQLIDKLVPFQAGIGIALLVIGLYNLLLAFRTPSIFDFIHFAPLFGITLLAMIVSAILLGFLFGMPQIVKWLPANAAAQKGLAQSNKLASFQVVIGVVGIASSLIFFLYRFSILKVGW